MLEFLSVWVFFLIPLPLLSYFLLPAKEPQKIAALKVANNQLFGQGEQAKQTTNNRSLIVYTLVWLLLIIATARPQWVGEPIIAPTQARELILAVDLSASMQEEDMRLNGRWVDRLTMVKTVLKEFIDKRKGDRIGLILFADNAYVQAPLTFDLTTVQTLLDESFLGLVGKRTAIGEAIGLAVKRFDNKPDSNRVLVLLTDGENTAGNLSPEQALELAIAKEVTIYTIGVGSAQGRQVGFFNRASGIDEQSLTQIADATNGRFFRATDTDQLSEIYKTLDKLEQIESNVETMRPQSSLYFWPLGLALFLSFIALALKLYRGRR